MESSRNEHPLLTAIAMVTATFLIAQHIAAKATRDALFLTLFDVSRLPTVMMASAAVSVAAVLLVSRLLSRFGPIRLIPPLYLISALLLALQWYLSDIAPRVAAVALYLHASALNSILISGFWSVINERFDPYSAKQIIPKLTAATTFGGVVGGLAAKAVASAADTHTVLLMLSTMHLICALGVGFLAARARQGVQEQGPPPEFLAPLKSGSLIRRMAFLTLLVATTAGVLDYILKAQASSDLSPEQLITFFSYFYTAVGLGTFLLQTALGRSALRWLGLGGTMAAWPLAILITGSGALVARSLITVTALRSSANLLYNSFFRAGFELLYTPIPAAGKRAGKVLIDVGADRLGDMVSGLIILMILAFPVAHEELLLITAMSLAGFCLVQIAFLNRGYVAQLADNLRSGTLHSEELEVVDATTARTVALTQASIERDKLLQAISTYDSGAARAASEPPQPIRTTAPSAPADSPPSPTPASPQDLVIENIADLRSDDEDRIKRVLTGQRLTAPLLPHAIPLLADHRVLQETLRAIRTVASSAPGQLVDALLDRAQHPLVKRRLPLLLARSDSPIALQGLTTGLAESDWNVRYRCGTALHKLRQRHPETEPDRDQLTAAIEKELRALAAGAAAGPAPDSTTPPAWDDVRSRRIELVFLLLGALYEPETLEICLHAFESDDPGLQGTAMEYLENLLPAHLWNELQAHLGTAARQPTAKRSLQQAARDLMASAPLLRAKRRARAVDTGADTVD